eukprot:scaffold329295_cov97-Tisochrysis_lutea.AAC.2
MAGGMQRVISVLQQQPLLRIHRRRLRWRDAKHLVVEQVDAVEESAVANTPCHGTSPTRSARLALTEYKPLTSTAPPGSATLNPSTAPLDEAPVAGAARDAKKVAIWRAVGWSKTSVLGSDAAPPKARWSWLPSSTAPKESRPDSINGMSASIRPPAIRRAVSTTAAKSTAARDSGSPAPSDDAVGTTAPPSISPDSSTGVAGIVPTSRRQSTSTSAKADGARGCNAAAKATAPSAASISLIPDRCSRAPTASPAAMPTLAHGPHCTLEQAWPHNCRCEDNASKQQFAAL